MSLVDSLRLMSQLPDASAVGDYEVGFECCAACDLAGGEFVFGAVLAIYRERPKQALLQLLYLLSVTL